MALEPGTLAGAGQSDRQHHRALRLLRWRGLNGSFGSLRGDFRRRFGLGSFAGWSARCRQRRSLAPLLLWTIAPPSAPTPAAAVSPQLLRRSGGALRGGLGLLQLGLIRLDLEFRLLTLGRRVRGWLGKLRLQRRGRLRSGLFRLRLAPPVAVTWPSSHDALVTRFPSRGQSAYRFCDSGDQGS